jgi:cobalt/nickel transport system permease protein/cobalt/nickel transport protein
MSTRRFFVAFLLLALLVAGVASYYASSHPDGLEFVAEKTGFLASADDSPTAASPLADYSTKGIDDERLSGGVAGVAGSVMVLTLAGGLFWVLRRRDRDRDPATTPEA